MTRNTRSNGSNSQVDKVDINNKAPNKRETKVDVMEVNSVVKMVKIMDDNQRSSSKTNAKNDLLLNTDVLKKIRLTIGNKLQTSNDLEEDDEVIVEEIKEKSNFGVSTDTGLGVTWAGNATHGNATHATSNPSHISSQLNDAWTSLDCMYQDLIKTQKRNAKTSNNVTFNYDLWTQFDVKMMTLREMFHRMNQTNTNSTATKRALTTQTHPKSSAKKRNVKKAKTQ